MNFGVGVLLRREDLGLIGCGLAGALVFFATLILVAVVVGLLFYWPPLGIGATIAAVVWIAVRVRQFREERREAERIKQLEAEQAERERRTKDAEKAQRKIERRQMSSSEKLSSDTRKVAGGSKTAAVATGRGVGSASRWSRERFRLSAEKRRAKKTAKQEKQQALVEEARRDGLIE